LRPLREIPMCREVHAKLAKKEKIDLLEV
jgi:hypothetical protein